ncbi:MAG: hypothetical protein C5S48_05350 [Candidatus Methanogaster sp.]|nr:MAG: hypothetical protein C5S48_05350 [ANME-2 cluster archaeon]
MKQPPTPSNPLASPTAMPVIASMIIAVIRSVFSPQSPIVMLCWLAWMFGCMDMYLDK